MAYTVSITEDGGRVLVVVDGGDSDFSQGYEKGDLTVKRFEGSETFSLLKVETEETVCTFTKDTCIAPVAATAELLMTALNALLGAAPAPGLPAGAATNAKLDEVKALIGEAQDVPTSVYSLLGRLKAFFASVLLTITGNRFKSVVEEIGEVQGSPTANTVLARLKSITDGASGFTAYYDAGDDQYLIGIFRDSPDGNGSNTIQYFHPSDPTTAIIPGGPVNPVAVYMNAKLAQIFSSLGDTVMNPEAFSLNGRVKAISELLTPIDVAITPLTTQGATIDQSIGGRKMGAFQWVFIKNAGTDGLGTLYGSIDGTNFESLGTTGSQTADAQGRIRFDENWKILRFEFTTQTDAGSTFGGTFYAS